MTDHEAIQELLAGYALRALSGEDAAEVDRLLAEHVPTCAECTETLRAFAEVEGELGLAATPVPPPDLLLPRLRQDVTQPRAGPIRRRSALAWSAGVAVAAMVGLFAWNTVALNGRVSRAEDREQLMTSAIQTSADPHSETVTLDNQDTTAVPTQANTRLVAAYVPGERQMSIVGSGVPDPEPGRTYRLWLIRASGTAEFVGDFHPDDGLVVLQFRFDLAEYSVMIISEENEDSIGPEPSGDTRWVTTL